MPQAASARLALVAPTSGDPINLWPGQIQAIRDRLEAVAALYRTDVAANRPAAGSVNTGLFFIATDTGAVSVSTGTSWVTVNPADTLALSQNSASALRLTGAAGGITFGGDSSLYRRTTNQLASGGGLIAGVGAATTIDAFGTLPTGNANFPWAVTGAGRIRWSDGAAAFDTELFRDGVGILNLAGEFRSSGRYIVGLGTANEVRVGQGQAGIHFGTAQDTNLYRSAQDELRTDDAFIAGGRLSGNATGAANNSSSAAANALLSPMNTISAFIGTTANTSGFAATDASGVVRFSGSGVAWGDLGFFPTGGADRGHFRFMASANAFGTTPNARVGVGTLHVEGSATTGIFFGATQDTNLYRYSANRLRTDDEFSVVRAAVGDDALGVVTSADTAYRWTVQAGGTLSWGPGNGALDTNLYRSGADSLKTDDFLTVGQNLTVQGGQVYFGTAGDTNLYRSAANVLKTDDTFHAAGNLLLADGLYGIGGVSPGLFQFDSAGDYVFRTGSTERVRITTGGALEFGAARDTNLYRSAANVLKTDDRLDVAGGLGRPDGGGVGLVIGNGSHTLYGTLLFDTTGGGTPDVNLYRAAPNVLQTDDRFQANDPAAGTGGHGLLTNARNTVALRIGRNEDVSGYGVNDFVGSLRWPGSGVAHGDIAYYPLPGTDGSHFRFYRSADAVSTSVNDLANLRANNVYLGPQNTPATSGVEVLRVVRGEFDGAAMTTSAGSGWTLTRTSGGSAAGDYTVTFNTAFASRPTVTAISDTAGEPIGVTVSSNSAVRLRTSGSFNRIVHFIAVGSR